MRWGGSQRRWLVPIASVVILPAMLAFGAGSAPATSVAPSIEGTTASHVTAIDATLEATIDPHGAAAGVFYQFQLLLDPGEAPTEILCPSHPSGYSACAGTTDPGALPLGWISGATAQPGTLDLSSAGVVLQPGRTYYFRALAADGKLNEDLAEWEPPATVGETREFTTPVPPSISQESLPAAEGPQAVSLDLASAGVALEPGAKYSFRLVASSSAGESEGLDETFATPHGSTRVTINMPLEPKVALEGGVDPKTLPRKSRKPIFLTLNGKVSGGSGDPPVGFKALTLEFDKGGAIFTKGLPTCTPLGPGVEPAPGDRHRCDDALVGRGKVYFDIAIPERSPFGVRAPVKIYNGVPKNGNPVLLYKVYAHVPAATTFLTSAEIEPHHGKFGTKTTIRIPKIVSGNGALTGFSARIGRTWTYRGRRVSLLSARCSKGSLAMNSDMELTDGTAATGELTAPCTPRR